MTPADFGDYSVAPHEHEEGTLTKKIEHYTSMIPSGMYLTMAFGTAGLAAGLYLAGKKTESIFVGHWTSAILLMGIYNKIVKVQGSN